MSKIGVRLKINYNAIEQARLFPGKKGKYLDATVFIDTDNQDNYGNNGMITQDVSKEEREQGVKGPILGNCQVFYRENQSQTHGPASAAQPQQAPAQQAPSEQQWQGFDNFDDDPPF